MMTSWAVLNASPALPGPEYTTQGNSGSTMLNNIVVNIEQCWQQNIIQCSFQQP